ncbi:MAG: NERD domain-containing protein [Halobacteria archaeon]
MNFNTLTFSFPSPPRVNAVTQFYVRFVDADTSVTYAGIQAYGKSGGTIAGGVCFCQYRAYYPQDGASASSSYFNIDISTSAPPPGPTPTPPPPGGTPTPPPPPPPGDIDGDGIPDDRDACPNAPEKFNGFEDTDGCPDVVPIPEKGTVKVSSNPTGAQVFASFLPNIPSGKFLGNTPVTFEDTGCNSCFVQVSAPKFASKEIQVVIVPGQTREFFTTLDPIPQTGTLGGRVFDIRLRPLSGFTVTADGVTQFFPGSEFFNLDGVAVGTHPVTITKSGYLTLSTSATIQFAQQTNLLGGAPALLLTSAEAEAIKAAIQKAIAEGLKAMGDFLLNVIRGCIAGGTLLSQDPLDKSIGNMEFFVSMMVCSFFPPVNLANALVLTFQGKFVDAGLSALGAIPLGGDAIDFFRKPTKFILGFPEFGEQAKGWLRGANFFGKGEDAAKAVDAVAIIKASGRKITQIGHIGEALGEQLLKKKFPDAQVFTNVKLFDNAGREIGQIDHVVVKNNEVIAIAQTKSVLGREGEALTQIDDNLAVFKNPDFASAGHSLKPEQFRAIPEDQLQKFTIGPKGGNYGLKLEQTAEAIQGLFDTFKVK